jgi:hypothetical protein
VIPDREHASVMRDGLAAGDRVQLHINNGKKKAYIRNGLAGSSAFTWVGRPLFVRAG